MKALLLIAHGSRRAEANADLDFIAEGLRARGGFDIIRTAYLELAEPTIANGVAACVAEGVTDVILMPYFLSPGMHVTQDLERAKREFTIEFSKVTFRLAEPLGRHPLLIEIVHQRATTTRQEQFQNHSCDWFSSPPSQGGAGEGSFWRQTDDGDRKNSSPAPP